MSRGGGYLGVVLDSLSAFYIVFLFLLCSLRHSANNLDRRQRAAWAMPCRRYCKGLVTYKSTYDKNTTSRRQGC